MSGQTVLYDHRHDKLLDERRDHKKYVVQVAVCNESSETWVATAGWDAKVFLYHIGQGQELGAPVGIVTLATNPESLAFIDHPSERKLLIITRRDSTSLYF